MKYSFVAAALAAPIALAIPTKRQSTNIDTVVLQFALTLEHLENTFYKGVLAKFSAGDFAAAGYGANYYNNLKYISGDEQSHVDSLSAALKAAGQTPVSPCSYSFPYTDVQSFVTLSSVLEGVGTSAYLGGAPLITSKDYLTVAGSILVTEALHTSLQRAAVNEIPFASPYGTPLDPTSVYTLAALFITSCPAGNVKLPFTPFPTLSLTTTAGTCEQADCSPKFFNKRDVEERNWEPYSTVYAPAPTVTIYKDGGMVTVTKTAMATATVTATTGGGNSAPSSSKNMYALKIGQTASFKAASAIPAGSYLTFVSGLSVVSVPATISGMMASAAIPSAAMGQTYVFVTKSANNGKLDGTTVLFGPAILEVAPGAPYGY